MAIKIYDETPEEINEMVANGRKFTVLNNHSNIFIEFPSSKRKDKLKKEDGVLMAIGIERSVDEYVEIVHDDGTMAIARLDVKGSLKGCREEGLTSEHVSRLISKLSGELRDKAYTSEKIHKKKEAKNKKIVDHDSMSWAELKRYLRDKGVADDYDLRSESKTREALADETK